MTNTLWNLKQKYFAVKLDNYMCNLNKGILQFGQMAKIVWAFEKLTFRDWEKNS